MVSKLSGKFKNAPTDTSLVCSSVSERLNRDQSLSASDTVRPDNLGEENLLPVKRERQNLRVSVYVVNMRGQPLMPTTPKKVQSIPLRPKGRSLLDKKDKT